MKFLAIIPARGGSKGIPRKNVTMLAGKPLITWTIEVALACPLIGKTVVSTDDEEIASLARKLGAEVVMRPAELALDVTPTRPVLIHAEAETRKAGFAADAVVTLQPTSPLRTIRHLTEALNLYLAHPEAESLVSVTRVPHHMGPEALMEIEGAWGKPVSSSAPLRRQEKPQHWCRNGAAIYVTKLECLKDFIWGGKTLVYPMDKLSSVDVDDREDLLIAEALLLLR
jgi:CMP-N,N'-diacetyllegionaminic acid synthase